jgi:hypothetical protein
MEPQTPPPLAQLLEDCWQLDSKRRPTARQLVDRLTEIMGGGDLKSVGGSSQQGPSTRQREESRRAAEAALANRQEAVRKPKQKRGPLAIPAWLEASLSSQAQAHQVYVLLTSICMQVWDRVP